MASRCYTFATTGFLLPSRPVPLTLRGSVLHMDLLSSTNVNSQFFASIFNLTQKLAQRTPIWGLPDGRQMMAESNEELLRDGECRVAHCVEPAVKNNLCRLHRCGHGYDTQEGCPCYKAGLEAKVQAGG